MKSSRSVIGIVLISFLLVSGSVFGEAGKALGGRENRTRLEWITEQTVEPVWGINTHERFHPEEVSLIKDLGAQIVAFSYYWEEVEHEKGKFVWSEPEKGTGNHPWLPWSIRDLFPTKMTIDELLMAYKNNGFELSWLLLDGTREPESVNKWYLDDMSQLAEGGYNFKPVFGEDQKFIDAFANYAYQAAKRYGSKGKDLVHHWEIWGEPNGSHPDRVACGKDYMKLAVPAIRKIKEADPKAKVGAPNMSRIDPIFLKSCLEEGLADVADAITFHPYREWTFPEDNSNIEGLDIPDLPTYLDSTIGELSLPTYADEVIYMKNLIKRYSKGKVPELWMTEFGVQTRHKVESIKVTDQTQAKYLARFCIQNLALGIERIYLYELLDYGYGGYGLMSNGVPKPAYFAYKNIIALFEGKMKILPRLMDSKEHIDNLHQYFFLKEDGELLICFWQAMKGSEKYQGVKAEFTFSDPILAGYKKCRLYNPLLGADQYFEYSLKGNTLKATELKAMDYPMILRLTK